MIDFKDIQLKELLTVKYHQYNQACFIDSDPIQIPHRYQTPEDREISGFLTTTIAWGKRTSIIHNASRLMQMMGNAPYDFVMNANDHQIGKILAFTHRTFQGEDCFYFIHSLRNIYQKHGGLKNVFMQMYFKHHDMRAVLTDFRDLFFEIPGLSRTRKHLADVGHGSSAKRLNLFLRWMVRTDNYGVDFGIWSEIPASSLYLPLDIHTGNVGRHLALLTRKQNDWKAVEEITSKLREFDPDDPVKYDFALFGLGVFENVGKENIKSD